MTLKRHWLCTAAMVFSRLSVGFFRIAVNGRRRILFSSNQTTILSLGNAVALQSLAVPHDDFPALVRDQSLLSERVQCVRNAGSADAEHERQKFVSERQRVATFPICSHKGASLQSNQD